MAHPVAQSTIIMGHADPICPGGSQSSLLKEAGWPGADSRWCSYRGAHTRGCQVRRGETGTRVHFYKRIARGTRRTDQLREGEGTWRPARIRRHRPRQRQHDERTSRTDESGTWPYGQRRTHHG